MNKLRHAIAAARAKRKPAPRAGGKPWEKPGTAGWSVFVDHPRYNAKAAKAAARSA